MNVDSTRPEFDLSRKTSFVRRVSEPVSLLSVATEDNVSGYESEPTNRCLMLKYDVHGSQGGGANGDTAGSIGHLIAAQSADRDSPLSVCDFTVDSFMRSQSAPCDDIIHDCHSFKRGVTDSALPSNRNKDVGNVVGSSSRPRQRNRTAVSLGSLPEYDASDDASSCRPSRKKRQAVSLGSLPEYDANVEGAYSFGSIPQLEQINTVSSLTEQVSDEFENWIVAAANEAFTTWFQEQRGLMIDDQSDEGHDAHRIQEFRAGSDTGGSIDDLSFGISDDRDSVFSVDDRVVESFIRSQSAPCGAIIGDRHSFKRFCTDPALPSNENNCINNVAVSSGGSSRRHRTAVSLSSLPEYDANDDGADPFDGVPTSTLSARILDEFETWVGTAADEAFETWIQGAFQQQLLQHNEQYVEADEGAGEPSISTSTTRDGSAESVTAEDASSDGVSDPAPGLMLAQAQFLMGEQIPRVCFEKTFIERRLRSISTAMMAFSSKLALFPWRPSMIAIGAVCILLTARKHTRAVVKC